MFRRKFEDVFNFFDDAILIFLDIVGAIDFEVDFVGQLLDFLDLLKGNIAIVDVIELNVGA